MVIKNTGGVVNVGNFTFPKSLEKFTFGVNLNDVTLQNLFSDEDSLTFNNDFLYMQLFKSQTLVDGENRNTTIAYVHYPMIKLEDGCHTMTCELRFLGTDLLSLSGTIHDVDGIKIHRGELPVYSFSLNDGKLTLRYFSGDKVSELYHERKIDVSKIDVIDTIDSLDECRELLPNDKSQATIDVSDKSVEEVIDMIVKYVRDSSYNNINRDIERYCKGNSVNRQ